MVLEGFYHFFLFALEGLRDGGVVAWRGGLCLQLQTRRADECAVRELRCGALRTLWSKGKGAWGGDIRRGEGIFAGGNMRWDIHRVRREYGIRNGNIHAYAPALTHE